MCTSGNPKGMQRISEKSNIEEVLKNHSPMVLELTVASLSATETGSSGGGGARRKEVEQKEKEKGKQKQEGKEKKGDFGKGKLLEGIKCFDKAAKQVFSLMANDSMFRYSLTDEYKRLYKKYSQF